MTFSLKNLYKWKIPGILTESKVEVAATQHLSLMFNRNLIEKAKKLY